MATIVAQTISESGFVAEYTACEGAGDKVLNDGYTFISVTNTGGDTITVSVTAEVETVESHTYGDLSKGDATQVVEDTETIFLGPFYKAAFNDEDGYFNITYSPNATGLTIAALLVSRTN